ncbi:FAD-binding oxidoreductase [Dactylosporangium sp. NPDC051541]|uniref:FAD-binding oxidoreductase n=1 Tax=Dactylosporangium sp. NPDC051541 TaxID=3363977 RepID=UPI0037B47AB1
MRLDLSPLDGFRGLLVTPYHTEYEAVRGLFNARIRTRPALIARCADAGDVAAVVRFARDQRLPIAVRGGGHNASGLSLVEGGVVIDVGGMREISFNPAIDRAKDAKTANPTKTGQKANDASNAGINDASNADTADAGTANASTANAGTAEDGEIGTGSPTVTVGPGVGWRDIDLVTVPYGVVGPGGECPTVSNAGYSLGGGYGPLGRTFGLGCDHLERVEIVDADGRTLRVSEDEHADLFWALRGAGGAGFGVVTSLTYRLNPIPDTVIGGIVAWPLDRGREIFAAYRDLYADRADERLALCLLLTTEPYPEGEPVIAMYGMYVGPPEEAHEHFAPVLSLGDPLFSSIGETTYLDVMTVLGDEIVYGLQSKWLGGYFAEDGFDEDAFAVLIEGFRRAPSGFSMVRFDLLAGGAVKRVPKDATAFVHRDALHYASIIAQWSGEEETEANVAWVDDFHEALRPHLTGEVYQNYADRELRDWAAAYYGANYPRLRQIKAKYDPQDVFHHPQSVRLP